MLCMSCGIDVPASFKMAIQKNVCPGCEQSILTDKGKELLDELTQAMTTMPNDPAGIAGWLMSQYQMVKIGDGKLVNQFYSPGVINNPTMINNPTTQTSAMHNFLQRAGISVPPQLPSGFIKHNNVSDPKNLKEIANQLISQQIDEQYNELNSPDLQDNSETYEDEEAIPTNFTNGNSPPQQNSLLVSDPNLPPLKPNEVGTLWNVVNKRAMSEDDNFFANQERMKKLETQNKIKSKSNSKHTFWRG